MEIFIAKIAIHSQCESSLSPQALFHLMPHATQLHALQEISLRYFLEVVQTGSVTLAAERLQVAPSAVSRRIAHLESELKTPLFERRARGMLLNTAGEILASHVKRNLRHIEQVVSEIQSLQGLRNGTVRVACTEGLAADFVPSVIADFQRAFGEVRFVLRVAQPADVPDLVRQGEVDIGLNVSMVSERGIAVHSRYPSPILAVMHINHALASRKQLSLSQLTGYGIALPGPGTTLRQLLDISASRQNLVFKTLFECDRMDPCLAFTLSQGGISFSGELALLKKFQRGELVGIPLRDREMRERHLEVQTQAGRSQSPITKEFLAFICEQLEKSKLRD